MGARRLMLARHAEDLFWIGRYLERAEDTARMLDVTYHTVLEAVSGRTESELWSELLEVLFLDDVRNDFDAPLSEAIGTLLVADRGNPSSIVSIVARARDNARTIREWLSSEVWESLNELHLDLNSRHLAAETRTRPYDLLRRVKAGIQGVTGAAEASMPRGDGHRFYLLGQTLERSMITTRVVSVWRDRLGGFSRAAAYPEWVKLLKSVSAYEAYLREYRAAMEPGRVLQFLIQSAEFPRSVLYCLTVCEDLLSPMALGSVGLASRRSVGRLRAETEFADLDSLGAAGLPEFLQRLEKEILDLTHLIEKDYFRPGSETAMHAYETF